MEIKYSIILPYYKREIQLHNMIKSVEAHYHGRDDFELILVEDVKCYNNEEEHLALSELVKSIPEWINLQWITGSDEKAMMPDLATTEGISKAKGKYIIIGCPDVIHMTDILGGLDIEFAQNPDAYISCACASSISVAVPILNFSEFKYKHEKWYQHSMHKPKYMMHLAAMSKEQYYKAGGFNPEFSYGIAWGDTDFIDRIKRTGMLMKQVDHLWGVHQYHGPRVSPNRAHFRDKNNALYKRLKAERDSND